eukprot:273093_1
MVILFHLSQHLHTLTFKLVLTKQFYKYSQTKFNMPSRKRKRNRGYRGTVAHNKRKHKKNNKNQQKYKTVKEINYNIKNKNKQSLYKGNIFDKYAIPYFGVLNGLSIAFYKKK